LPGLASLSGFLASSFPSSGDPPQISHRVNDLALRDPQYGQIEKLKVTGEYGEPVARELFIFHYERKQMQCESVFPSKLNWSKIASGPLKHDPVLARSNPCEINYLELGII